MQIVLPGVDSDRHFAQALALMQSFETIVIGGREIAIQAARNYRNFRPRGITVRKTTDTLIAMRCIHDGISLLFTGRDFDPFVMHPGLTSALSRSVR